MLGRIGKTLAALRDGVFAGTSSSKRPASVAPSLPLNLIIAKPRHLPIWEIRQRPRNEWKLPQVYVGKALRGLDWGLIYARLPLTVFNPSAPQPIKRKRRALWRSIRRDLPPMPGRQWRKMRHELFRSAKAA